MTMIVMIAVLVGVMGGTGSGSPALHVWPKDYTFPNTRADIPHTHTQAQHSARNDQLLQGMGDSLDYTDDPLLFREFDDTPTKDW